MRLSPDALQLHVSQGRETKCRILSSREGWKDNCQPSCMHAAQRLHSFLPIPVLRRSAKLTQQCSRNATDFGVQRLFVDTGLHMYVI